MAHRRKACRPPWRVVRGILENRADWHLPAEARGEDRDALRVPCHSGSNARGPVDDLPGERLRAAIDRKQWLIGGRSQMLRSAPVE